MWFLLMIFCPLEVMILLGEWLTVFLHNRVGIYVNLLGVSEIFGVVAIVFHLPLAVVLCNHPSEDEVSILFLMWNRTRMIRVIVVEFTLTLVGELLRLAPLVIPGAHACQREDEASSMLTSLGIRASVVVGCNHKALLRTVSGIWFLLMLLLWYIILQYVYHMYWVA